MHWGKDKGNSAETLMLEEPTALGGLTLHAATHPCPGEHGGGRTLIWKGEFLFQSGTTRVDGYGHLISSAYIHLLMKEIRSNGSRLMPSKN